MPIFEKKSFFGFYQGAFMGHFSNSAKKKELVSRLGGVFPGEGKSRLGYVLKTSGHDCVQQ